MRHFSNLSSEEVHQMSVLAQDACIKYAQEINMSGLSHLGFHNIYTAIEDAITQEWEKSKAAALNGKKAA